MVVGASSVLGWLSVESLKGQTSQELLCFGPRDLLEEESPKTASMVTVKQARLVNSLSSSSSSYQFKLDA